MIKHLQNFFFLLVFLFFIPVAKAQLPYFESFREATARNVTFGGVPSAYLTASNNGPGGTAIDPVGQGFLRLTSNDINQKGFVYSTINFPSTQGLTIQFEYYTWGGNGADGISFFLFDATVPVFNIGGFGGSLGYAQINTAASPNSPGVSSGYLGIGLDEYGNFSANNEGRQGGIPELRPGSVTLRGKGNGNARVPTNYPFLTTIKTDQLTTNPFSLVGSPGGRETNPNNTGYRKVYLDMVPNTAGPGYYITVRITQGGTPMVTTTVIDNFLYSEAAPATLRYGLASSTGASTNYHEIRDVRITEYQRPAAVADESSTKTNIPVTLNVMNNDVNPVGSTVIKVTNPLNGTATVNTDGTVLYTPNNGFSGKDKFTYKLRKDGVDTDPVTVTVNVFPVGSADNMSTPLNTPVTFSLKDNDISKNGTTVSIFAQNPTRPANGTVTISPAGEMVYTPATGFTGTDGFSYRLTTADGLVSEPIAVTIDVNAAIPKAPDLSEIVPYGQPKKINIPVPACGTIVIKTNPIPHGTVTVSATNEVTYTPNDGYFGTDLFTYVYKDCNNIESLPGTVNITIPKPAIIGLSKGLINSKRNLDGSYNLDYIFAIVNPNPFVLKDISLIDDLSLTFPNSTIVVNSLTGTGELATNPAYDGVKVKDLLLPSSLIQPGLLSTVSLKITVTLSQGGGTFNNNAQVKAVSTNDNSEATAKSTNGLVPVPDANGNYSNSSPTPAILNFNDLFIPGGFSPNDDGIHDKFVIENIQGRKIHLQIFNRWSNKIYESKEYQNTWDGKATTGIRVGEDVPAGTYFYIITIDGLDKRIGHITINR